MSWWLSKLALKFLSKRGRFKFMIMVVVEPDGDKYHAFCPALPGLHVDGDTEEAAIDSAAKTASLYIRSLIKHGDPIPIGPYMRLQNITTCIEESKAITPMPVLTVSKESHCF